MPRPTTISARIVLVLVLTLVIGLLLAAPVLAHTSLASSSPADSTRVDPPPSITLTFSKAIRTFDDTIVLTGSDGSEITPRSTASEDGTVVTAPLEESLPAGTWTVTWRVLADDSHPREGVFTFAVPDPPDDTESVSSSGPVLPDATESPVDDTAGPVTDDRPPPTDTDPDAAAATTPAAAGTPSGLERAAGVFRVLFYLGLMAATGLALFKAGPHSGMLAGAVHLARWVVVTAAVAFVASMLEVAAHVGSVSGQGLVGILDLGVWRVVLGTGLGTALLLRSVGLGLLIVGGRRRALAGLPSAPDARTLLGVALALGSFQFVGHTASVAPAAIVRTADGMHAIAAAIWIGGLVGLAVVTRRGNARTKIVTVGRFSSWATAAVIGVSIAGVALTVTNLPTVSAAWTTGYGRLLLAKLVIVGGLAALGAHNHVNIVPHVADGDRAAVAELRRVVSVEVALAVVVVALTALLVNTSPV